MDVLVTYDVDTSTPAGERRLTQVARVCEGFGVRVQKSVFECRLTETGLERLVTQLLELIDKRSDSVNIYSLEASLPAHRRSLGRPPLHEIGRPWIM